jgi:Amt family ammonium transporter
MPPLRAFFPALFTGSLLLPHPARSQAEHLDAEIAGLVHPTRSIGDGLITYLSQAGTEVIILAIFTILTLIALIRTQILRNRISARSQELQLANKALEAEIRGRRRVQQDLDLERAYFSQLFANSPQAIILIGRDGAIVDLNAGFEKLFGVSKEDLAHGFDWKKLIPGEYVQEAISIRKTILGGKPLIRETVRVHKQGYPIPVCMTGYPVLLQGRIEAIFYIYSDISERKSFEEQLVTRACYDTLTGLPNRSLFLDRLNRAIVRRKQNQNPSFAVLMLDLDRFKRVNDSLGHQAGDALLAEIGSRLQRCVRSMDTVARFGGDEFAILLEDLSTVREILPVIERIQRIMDRSCRIANRHIHTSTSIGVVLDGSRYDTADPMLRDADIAMYRAKDRGPGKFKIFNQRMHVRAEESLYMENALRQAMGTAQISLHYQPIVSVSDASIIGFEALLRWNHPEIGRIAPDRFIPLAEETGLIIQLGQWVLHEACTMLARWRSMPGNDSLTMSVNLSTRQLEQKDLVPFISRLLSTHDLPGSALKLEITENLLMQNSRVCLEKLQELKKLELDLAVDDFGTGYSSLSYLQQFPVDQLKIDRSFVSGQSATTKGREIVRAIIDMARHLKLKVVAEGVEEQDQLIRLRDQGCDHAQGYFFSRPLCQEKAEGLLCTPGDHQSGPADLVAPHG